MPPGAGRILCEGRKAIQFWVRAFGLEGEVDTVRELLEEKPERKKAMVPIVAEYQVDDRFKFIFVLQTTVDALGIASGVGVIYWASPEHEKEVYERRDKYANDLLRHLASARKFDEMIEIEMKKEE